MKHTFKFKSKEEMNIARGRIEALLSAQAGEHLFDSFSKQCVSINDLSTYVYETDISYYHPLYVTHFNFLKAMKVNKWKKEIRIDVFYLTEAAV